jgi:DNA mismatch endonuclease (patch repair protein)
MGISRSENMSRIRGKNTKPELIFRSALWAAGLRYRLHAKTPVGRPDVVFPGPRVAVFIDGGFWHGCPEHYVRPRSRDEFWSAKLDENLSRDRRQTLELEKLGWRVVRVWEHEVFENLKELVELVREAVQAKGWTPRPSWRVRRVEAIDETGDFERRHLELLRDPARQRAVEQKRNTKKWKRPK